MSSSIPNSKDKVYVKVKVMSAYVRHPYVIPRKQMLKVLPGVTTLMGVMISKAVRNRIGRTAQENGASLPGPGGGRAT